jgi:hypothetical protein
MPFILKTDVKIINDKYNQTQHLYITNDDEIKEGNWCLQTELPHLIEQCKSYKDSNHLKERGFKKIIATTDASLHGRFNENIKSDIYSERYKLPKPSQEFIEKYVSEYNKSRIITEVDVEYDYGICTSNFCYKDKCDSICNKLKVEQIHNTIIIHPIKDSWNREELIVIEK